MQEISSNRIAGIIECNDALIAGVRSVARRMSCFVRTPFDKLKANGFLNFTGLLGRMNKLISQSRTASLVSRHEVVIMYFGRTSESLMMTSERMVIPSGRYTLGQLLSSLYKRGDQWAYELDDSHLLCTVDGRDARLFETIKPGVEICLFSRKSIFEA